MACSAFFELTCMLRQNPHYWISYTYSEVIVGNLELNMAFMITGKSLTSMHIIKLPTKIFNVQFIHS
jgi:hypothetical protein